MLHPESRDAVAATALRRSAARPEPAAALAHGTTRQIDYAEGVSCRIGDSGCVARHADALGRSPLRRAPSSGAPTVLRLQRQYGNTFARSVLSEASLRRQEHPAAEPDNVLGAGENFRWLPPPESPTLVLRRSWLIAEGVRRPAAGHATSIMGTEHPTILRPVLEAILDLYPWANRERALAGLDRFYLETGSTIWEHEELHLEVTRRVFLIVGLPPTAPIQLYPTASGFEFYVDLSYLEAEPAADPDALERNRATLAEQMLALLEQRVGRPVEAGMRPRYVAVVQRWLAGQRGVVSAPLGRRQIVDMFGEQAARDAIERSSRETDEHGTVISIPGGGVSISPDLPAADRALLDRFVRLVGHGAASRGQTTTATSVATEFDMEALKRLMADPQRDALIAIMRERGTSAEGWPVATLTDLIETARAQLDIRQAHRYLRQERPSGAGDREPPIVPRPVHGRILATDREIVSGMQTQFVFELADRVDAFRVPFIRIKWGAYPKPARTLRVNPNEPVETDHSTDIEVRSRTPFLVRFPRPGNYEVHAFVDHNFYLPAHFERDVAVKSEDARLRELETEAAPAWGREAGRQRYRFGSIAAEEQVTTLALSPATLAEELLGGRPSGYEWGTRAEGVLAPGATAEGGAAVGPGAGSRIRAAIFGRSSSSTSSSATTRAARSSATRATALRSSSGPSIGSPTSPATTPSAPSSASASTSAGRTACRRVL